MSALTREVVFETFESNTALLGVSNGLTSAATTYDSIITKDEAVLAIKHYFRAKPLFNIGGPHYVFSLDNEGYQIAESVMFYTTDSGDTLFVLRTDEQSDILKTRIYKYSYADSSMSIVDAVQIMEYHRSARSFSL